MSGAKMQQKIAIVTGAARRIGRAISLRLVSENFRVAIHYGASRHAAEALVRQIEAEGGRAIALGGDLANPLEATRIVEETAENLGPVDLLVNNAAIFERDSIENLDLTVWRRQFAVNLESPVFLAAAFSRALPADRRGAIVNVIDQRVLRLTPRNLSYTLAKSALWTATQTLAQALAPRIRVNAVAPGPTFANPRDGENGLAHETAGTLLQRRVAGEEIAEAVAYLAKAESVTGQLIAVDAGQHLGWRTPDIVD